MYKSLISTGILQAYRYEYPYFIVDQSLFAIGRGIGGLWLGPPPGRTLTVVVSPIVWKFWIIEFMLF